MSDIQELLKLQPILLFDGECGFCNRTIQFFLKRENRKKSMHFAPLQSEQGIVLRRYFEIGENTDSLVLIKGHDAYIKSCAALRLTMYMKGLWPLLMVFVVIPPFLRNIAYDFIAKRRMRLFGRVESCALLKKEDRSRFLAF
jgi:predicted DCC family thiol-disulfide oxidoreductase YuxK